jgi:hypothetical protein
VRRIVAEVDRRLSIVSEVEAGADEFDDWLARDMVGP